jgi:integrase
MKLTHKECANAKPTEKVRRLHDGQGLVLEIRPQGGKYWRLKYRYANKDKMLAIGVYPLISLQEAREKRDEARKLLANGIDPMQAKHEKRLNQQLEAENTFESLARDWHANWKVNKQAKHAFVIMNRLERDVFPEIGKLSVNKVTPRMILDIMRKTEARGAYDVARRIKQTCGLIFKHGVVEGRADRNITADLPAAMRPYKAKHFAALEIEELPDFLRMIERNDMRLQTQTRLAIKMLMLTFVRTNELIKARWDEFDFDRATWKIPGERMKMKLDHIVPLSDQVVRILQQLKEMNGHRQWVFPSMARPRDPMSNATIIRAITRMGYKDRMTGHGFRALAMTTIMEKLGYRHEVVDLQLAHTKGDKIRAAYDRTKFLSERRKMMQNYADYIDQIMA